MHELPSKFHYLNIVIITNNWHISVLWALLFILLANCWECLVRGYTWLEQLEPLLLNVTSYPPPTLQTLQGFQNFQREGFSMFYCCIQIYRPLLKHYIISYQHFLQTDFQIVHVLNYLQQGTLQGFQISNKQGLANFDAASNALPTLHTLQGFQHFKQSGFPKTKGPCGQI
jgi:hypothetical protein